MSKDKYVYVRLLRPEGYEDVHPDLVLADAGIGADFEPEIIDCGEVERLRAEPTEEVQAIARRLVGCFRNCPGECASRWRDVLGCLKRMADKLESEGSG
jgi:hypothetical protein